MLDFVARRCGCDEDKKSSCSLSCIMKRLSLRKIAGSLKKMYYRAAKYLDNRTTRELNISCQNNSLLYLSDTDHCQSNVSAGSLGTAGRECSISGDGDSAAGSCQYLCCGRGYQNRTITRTSPCGCQFILGVGFHCQQCHYTEQITSCV